MSATYVKKSVQKEHKKSTVTRLALALALAGFSLTAQAGKIISVPSASGASGFGGWNLDNVTIELSGTNSTFDELTGAYFFDLADTDFSYVGQVFADDTPNTLLGYVQAKGWPVGEPAGIKIVNDDFDVKEGRATNCIMSTSYLDGHYLDDANPEQVLCSGPFQSHKRYKLAMLPDSIADGALGIDLVFNVEADGTTRDYQVFQKINNWTNSRLQGFSIQVGTGQGASFIPASDEISGVGVANLSVSVPGDVWTADQLANFSSGLFGPIDNKHGRPAGYFDPVNPAGFSIVEYPISRGQTDTLNSGAPLPSAYADVPAGAALASNQFGAWLPNSMLPYGIFFDDDNNPSTDAELIAWYGYNPNLLPTAGFTWMEGAAGNFAPIPESEIISKGTNLAYTMGVIDDLVNVGLNYIVTIGDVSVFPGYNAEPVLNTASFTIRITPKVQEPQDPAPGFVAEGLPAPALKFTSADGVVVIDPSPTFSGGELLTARVGDADLNTNPGTIETVDINISSSNGLTDTLTLTELGEDRGVFAASLPDAFSAVPAGTVITVTYTDADDGTTTNVEKTAATTMAVETLQFDPSAYTVAENGGSVDVTVVRTGGSTGVVSVDYLTSSGTASGGLDYTADTGTLTFADGVTTQTISIPVLTDLLAEDDEIFSIMLSAATGTAVLGAADTAEITITDVAPERDVGLPVSSSDSGGFCSYQPNGRFDPILPGIILAGLAYLGWRRKQRAA